VRITTTMVSPIDVEEEGGVTTPVDPTMDEDNLQQREKLGRAAGRYSFSLKRSLIPSTSDSPSRKKGGKSGVSTGGANTKGDKPRVSTGGANRKGGKSGVSTGGANTKGGKSRVSTGGATTKGGKSGVCTRGVNVNEGEKPGLPLAKKPGGR
jgi:hypothetical protein